MERCGKCRHNYFFFLFLSSLLSSPPLLDFSEQGLHWSLTVQQQHHMTIEESLTKGRTLQSLKWNYKEEPHNTFWSFGLVPHSPPSPIGEQMCKELPFPVRRVILTHPHIIKLHNNAISEFPKWFSKSLWAPFFKKGCYPGFEVTLDNDWTDFI